MITDNILEKAKEKAKEKYNQYKNDKNGKLVKSCYLSICHAKNDWDLLASIITMNNTLKKYFNDTDCI